MKEEQNIIIYNTQDGKASVSLYACLFRKRGNKTAIEVMQKVKNIIVTPKS